MITNLKSNKSYIGKSQNENPYYMGSGLLIWNSYRKEFRNPDLSSSRRRDHRWVYDKNKELQYYKKTILQYCDSPVELCELEKYYIDKYNTVRPNGYNIASGGEGGFLTKGYNEEERHTLNKKISETTKSAMNDEEIRKRFLEKVQNKSDEWRKNISKSLTGRKSTPMSEETKEKLRLINIGNKYGVGNKSRTGMHNSEEMNKKISEGLKGVVHTDEWNKHVSEALKGKSKTEEHKQKLRKPKPKYKWLLPNGEIRIMDPSNGSRHKDWIKLERIS